MELDYFGIVTIGSDRVINEFQNGNIYMIESNRCIDFIGEVTILAKMPKTSVTIEAVEDCLVFTTMSSDEFIFINQIVLSYGCQTLPLLSKREARK